MCDEDGNVVLILARMELERIVEDGASIEGQALQQFAEAAYPLVDVVGAGFDQTGTGTSWRQPSRRSRATGGGHVTRLPAPPRRRRVPMGRRVAEPQDRGSADRRDRDQPASRHVTSRVESDRALQESQERYRAIVETAQEGIWVANPQGRTVYVNQKMADIADRSNEELYSRGILELLDVDDSTMLSHRLLERRTAGTEEYELHLRHPDGTWRCLKVCSSPLWDRRGRIGRVARHGLRHHGAQTSGASSTAPGSL